MSGNPIFQFRVNLTRSDLIVNGIDLYAECLMADFDQMSYSLRREKAGAGGNPTAKKLEETPGQPCRYFATKEGCRKGKSRRFLHEIKDGER